jgi:hypothetical protein
MVPILPAWCPIVLVGLRQALGLRETFGFRPRLPLQAHLPISLAQRISRISLRRFSLRSSVPFFLNPTAKWGLFLNRPAEWGLFLISRNPTAEWGQSVSFPSREEKPPPGRRGFPGGRR